MAAGARNMKSEFAFQGEREIEKKTKNTDVESYFFIVTSRFAKDKAIF